MYRIPEFKQFPIVFHPFNIPENSVWYRASAPAEVLTNELSFFGSKRTASMYIPLKRELKAFRNIKFLRILDIRYIQSIMRLFMESRTSNVITPEIEAYLLKIYIALGICSLQKTDSITFNPGSE